MLEFGVRLVSLIVLAVVIIFLVHPITLHIPLAGKKRTILIDLAIVPVIGVIVLLISGALTFEQLWNGVIGDEDMQPYAIIILFFSLAYLCVSLDVTGLFDFISLYAISKTGGPGWKLFMVVFSLSSIMTLVTSNDIVILTITPILCTVAKYTKIDPTPFLVLQFFMANIWSIILVIGNPTNIIVAEANHIAFLEFTTVMILPAIGAGIMCLVLIWIRFRKDIPALIQLPEAISPKNALKDTPGAIFGSVCLLCCLVLLVSTSWYPNVRLWWITLASAIVISTKDIYHGIRFGRVPIVTPEPTNLEDEEEIPKSNVVASKKSKKSEKHLMLEQDEEYDDGRHVSRGDRPSEELVSIDLRSSIEQQVNPTDKNVPLDGIVELDESSEISEHLPPPTDDPNPPPVAKDPQSTETEFLGVTVIKRLPWKIVPFLFSVFIIVESLKVANWTTVMAEGLASAIGRNDTSASIAASVFIVGASSSLSCNILNNQPMTVLFNSVLFEEAFDVGPVSQLGAMYALVIGSNLGANLTLVGALAGIMWSSILSEKGFEITYFKFASHGFLITPFVIGIACAILSIQLLLG